MKILCLTDTHGDIDLINKIIKECPEEVDFILNAGDIGIYDEESVERLQERELQLRIKHNYSIPYDERKKLSLLEGKELKEIIKTKYPLSSFPDYISGKKKFLKPVFAVWGNHDDFLLVNKLREGKLKCENFHILDENNQYDLGEGKLLLWGLGGNLITENDSFFSSKGIIGEGGIIASSLHQYGTLINNVKKKLNNYTDGKGISIGVTHVSPGMEVFLRKLSFVLKPDFMISGHMGPPFVHTWNEKTIREYKETNNDIRKVNEIFEKFKGKLNKELSKTDNDFKSGVEFMSRKVKGELCVGKITFMNIPDASDMGYSVLTVNNEGSVSVKAYSKGKIIKKGGFNQTSLKVTRIK